MRGSRLFKVLAKVLAAAFLLVVVLGVLFPAVSDHGDRQPKRAEAKGSITRMTATIKQYYVEYGRWPDVTGDGRFLDATGNARVMGVLRGPDEIKNPRKIVFFEGAPARKSKTFGGHWESGFDPQSGAFLDPWGNPYRIVVDADYDETISNPYSLDDHPSLRAGVIVWCLGTDGQQGAPGEPLKIRGSDDIVSWQ